MSSAYHLTLNRNAVKFLAKQEKTVQDRIRAALIGLTVVPPEGDIRPMKGSDNQLRLRVGSFRILFEVDYKEQVISILTIGNRGDIY